MHALTNNLLSLCLFVIERWTSQKGEDLLEKKLQVNGDEDN